MNAAFGSGNSGLVLQALEQSLGADATHGELRAVLGADAQLRMVSDWERRGAETYSLFFDSANSHGVQRYVLKVCIAGYGDHTGTVDRWMERRTAVAGAGIQVPVLLARAGSAFCEEYVPLSLGDALAAGSPDTGSLVRALAVTLGGLKCLGFNPGRLDDLRSRGTDVVVVDFGADLTLPWDGDLGRMIRQYAGSELRGSLKEDLLGWLGE